MITRLFYLAICLLLVSCDDDNKCASSAHAGGKVHQVLDGGSVLLYLLIALVATFVYLSWIEPKRK